MNFKLRHSARHTSDEGLLDDIKRVAELLKEDTISRSEYDKHGKFSSDTPKRRFGSWKKALQKAGLNLGLQLNIPPKKLFENLEVVWHTLGRQPFFDEMKRPLSKYNISTYSRRFGSWHKACEEFIKYKKGDIEFVENAKQYTSTARSRSINNKSRLKILKRDNYKCVLCGRSPATHGGIFLHIDHIQPFSKGGANNMENLRTLCQKCNLGKGVDENL